MSKNTVSYTVAHNLKRGKKRVLHAFACIGSHGDIFVTEASPHEATVGRLQVYHKEQDARRNDDRVVPVQIIYEVPKNA